MKPQASIFHVPQRTIPINKTCTSHNNQIIKQIRDINNLHPLIESANWITNTLLVNHDLAQKFRACTQIRNKIMNKKALTTSNHTRSPDLKRKSNNISKNQISNNPFITTTLQTSYKIRCTSLWWPRSGWLDFQNLPILRLSRIIRPWATYSCIILYGWTSLVLVPMDDPQWVYHVLVGRVIGSQIAICPHLLWWPTGCPF